MDVPLEFTLSFFWFLPLSVSILVLMDVPLESSFRKSTMSNLYVSILVLMDVPLEFLGSGVQETNRSCFNPCFNGCASRIPSNSLLYPIMACFNPCFNGCASRIPPLHAVFVSLRVSILVLMDVPLEYG